MDESTDPAAPAPSAGEREPISDEGGQLRLPVDPSPTKDEERKTLLDAVRDAVDPKSIAEDEIEEKPAPTAESSPAASESSKPSSEAKPNGLDEVTDEGLLAVLDKLKTDVPLNKIERFREVIQENRSLKSLNERYKAIDTTLTEIGIDARKMGLSNEDVAALFAWPRLLAKDPNAAVEQLQAFASQWQERVGKTLPADLAKKVEDGVLDEATAKEVAQLRASTALSETRGRAEAADREQEAEQKKRADIRDSVNAYQAELKANDPDYTLEKHQMTCDALSAMVSMRGLPANVTEARAMAKEAYDTVSKRLAAFKPQPRAIATAPAARRLNQPAQSRPTSMLEAVTRALE